VVARPWSPPFVFAHVPRPSRGGESLAACGSPAAVFGLRGGHASFSSNRFRGHARSQQLVRPGHRRRHAAAQRSSRCKQRPPGFEDIPACSSSTCPLPSFGTAAGPDPRVSIANLAGERIKALPGVEQGRGGVARAPWRDAGQLGGGNLAVRDRRAASGGRCEYRSSRSFTFGLSGAYFAAARSSPRRRTRLHP